MKSSLANLAKGLLRLLGLDLVRLHESSGTDGYQEVRPLARYAPWTTSADFLSTYQRIQANTLVDVYRCWELWTLVGQLGKLEPGAILEVGVWRGGTGALMARRSVLSGSSDRSSCATRSKASSKQVRKTRTM